MRRVRTRFAPSPTGFLHIGGLRTALYNYLLARHYGGDFILRIEDTDQTRFVPEAQDYITQSLNWLKIMPNEGVGVGGSYGPYIQSQRKEIYQKYALRLVENGWAYYAFDTDEELEEMHQRLINSNISNPQYNFISREFMKNSLTLSPEEVKRRIDNGYKYVIRFKIPAKETVRFYDVVRGWIKVDSSTLDDKVLLKSDGMATYHLASVVDDHLMDISHVIRGEEWLPSAPLHILMYKAFGWGETMPSFVHLSLLLKPDGKGKLSKRDADEGGFSIFPLSYFDERINKEVLGLREQGFLPEAIVNAVSLLGWSPGCNKEIYHLDELIESFSVEKLQKAGARFNFKKIEWFNHQFIKMKSITAILEYIKNKSNDAMYNKYSSEELEQIGVWARERATTTEDIYTVVKPFFEDVKICDEKLEKLVNLFDKSNIYNSIGFIDSFLDIIKDRVWAPEELHRIIKDRLSTEGLELKDVMPVFRMAIFGSINGPDVVTSIIILGQEITLQRVNNLKTIIVSYYDQGQK